MSRKDEVGVGTFDDVTASTLYLSGEWTQPEWSESSRGWKMVRLKSSLKRRE